MTIRLCEVFAHSEPCTSKLSVLFYQACAATVGCKAAGLICWPPSAAAGGRDACSQTSCGDNGLTVLSANWCMEKRYLNVWFGFSKDLEGQTAAPGKAVVC